MLITEASDHDLTLLRRLILNISHCSLLEAVDCKLLVPSHTLDFHKRSWNS
jgi:hypothetical protein